MYYACSDYALKYVLEQGDGLAVECLHKLVLGRNELIALLTALVSRLPDYLRNGPGDIECPA